ncbi:signal recognition particle protein [bacterium]|nr:signal recognition particle protein [bacterium]
MFDVIANGFKNAKNRLQGKAEITADNIKEALKDVRQSLLEADVEFKVVKAFLKRVEEKATGEIVQVAVKHQGKKVKIKPGDIFVKICKEELEALMGPVDTSIKYREKGPTVIMMMGLQGSGKTTTTGKLAKYLMERENKHVLLVAADIYRPAAVDQLQIIGERLDVKVFHLKGEKPPKICSAALEYAKEHKYQVMIIDTAGRLAIDEALMKELEEIDNLTKPDNKFLVVDAMIGQDAVHTAKEFNTRISIDGVILTKLDGDARGGAALSIKEVTEKPIKFLGMGEGLTQLEPFRPEGLASRILGLGDIVGLVQDFEHVVDEKAEIDAMKMLSGEFNFYDFKKQIEMINKLGSVKDLVAKMPMGGMKMPDNVDESMFKKVSYIIDSMTHKERSNPDLINESRMIRISKGSGRSYKEVKELMMQFNMMKQMMNQLSMGNTGFLSKIPGIKQLMQLKDMKNMFSGGMGGMGGMPGFPGMPGFDDDDFDDDDSKNEKQPRLFNRTSRDKKKKEASKSRKQNQKKKK